MAVAVPEPISPELVLVCPELAAAARAALPDRDLDLVAPPRRAVASSPAPSAAPLPPVWASVLVYAASSVVGLAVRSALWVLLLALVLTVPLFF